MTTFTPILVPVALYVVVTAFSSLTLGDTALDTRIEGISRKERQHLRLALKPLVVSVVVHQRLEPCVSADGFSRASFDMVNIVVMQEPEVWRGVGVRPTWRRRDHLFFC
jgi:hypothetical protein